MLTGRNCFAPKPGQPFAAESERASVQREFEDVVERLKGNDVNDGTGHEAERLPMSQSGGVVVLHFADGNAVSFAKIAEPFQLAMFEVAIRTGNWMAMRVFDRFAEVGSNGGFEAWRDCVFERFRFGVHFAPIETEHASEEELDEPMPTDDVQGFLFPLRCELGPVARFVFDPTRVIESLEHPRDRRSFHIECRRNICRRHDAARSAQAVDRFQIILNGLRRLLGHGWLPQLGA